MTTTPSPRVRRHAGRRNAFAFAAFGGLLAASFAAVAAPDARLRVVQPITDNASSVEPEGRLLLGPDGMLYGTLSQVNFYGVYGSVYRIERDGTTTPVVNFSDYTEGILPEAALVNGPGGWIYGTTGWGGNASDGVIFRFQPDGTYEKLADFTEGPGTEQNAKLTGPLAVGPDSTVYGTSQTNYGAPNLDTVYSLRQGQLATLHVFDGADGISPNGVVFGADGRLYGTTSAGGAHGGGVLYAMTTAGAYEVLHDFDCAADGCGSIAALLRGDDGWFYGTTPEGGTRPAGLAGAGTVFRWQPGTGFQVVHVFAAGAPEGQAPALELSQDKRGNLYGATQAGGAYGYGAVFAIAPAGHLSVLHAFTGGLDGGNPWTGPTVKPGDKSLFGVTTTGGGLGNGAIYRLDAR